MIDLTTPCQVWRDERGNAGALLASIIGVLLLAVEEGVSSASCCLSPP